MRLPVPPGLTCAECRLALRDGLSRRTLTGWVHATPCVSPDVLPGRWVHPRRRVRVRRSRLMGPISGHMRTAGASQGIWVCMASPHAPVTRSAVDAQNHRRRTTGKPQPADRHYYRRLNAAVQRLWQ